MGLFELGGFGDSQGGKDGKEPPAKGGNLSLTWTVCRADVLINTGNWYYCLSLSLDRMVGWLAWQARDYKGAPGESNPNVRSVWIARRKLANNKHGDKGVDWWPSC